MTYICRLSNGCYYEIINKRVLSNLKSLKLVAGKTYYMPSIQTGIYVINISFSRKVCTIKMASNKRGAKKCGLSYQPQ